MGPRRYPYPRPAYRYTNKGSLGCQSRRARHFYRGKEAKIQFVTHRWQASRQKENARLRRRRSQGPHATWPPVEKGRHLLDQEKQQLLARRSLAERRPHPGSLEEVT